MIIFKHPTTLTLIDKRDKKTGNIISEYEQTFKARKQVQASIFSEDGDYVDLRFEDGSVALGVQRESFVLVVKR